MRSGATLAMFFAVLSSRAVAAAPAPAPAAPAVPPADPVTPAETRKELGEKMVRVKKLLADEKLGGVLLTQVRNFSWATAGVADNHIVITSEIGAASILLLKDGRKILLANSIEAPRLMAEGMADLGFELRDYTWYEDRLQPDRKLAIIRELTGGAAVGTDVAYADLRVIDGPITQIRTPLTEPEIKKYRWVGRRAAEAIGATIERIRPGMSETEIEAIASDELMRRGLRPTVLLVGSDDRIRKFRHDLPSAARVQKYAIVNLCARRWGLVVSTSRLVHFGPVPEDLKQRIKVAARVNSELQAGSRPGVTAGQLFEIATRAYAAGGFPGEEKLHHQGGAAGYGERDWIAFPGSTDLAKDRQAFAWNPTVQGTKTEDTILVNRGKVENLTSMPGWPTIAVKIKGKTFLSPDILVKAAPPAAP